MAIREHLAEILNKESPTSTVNHSQPKKRTNRLQSVAGIVALGLAGLLDAAAYEQQLVYESIQTRGQVRENLETNFTPTILKEDFMTPPSWWE